MMRSKKHLQAFSLLELMIVLTIIAILAAIAIPNYQLYVKKAKFSEVITHITPYKASVEICAQLLGSLGDAQNNCGTPGQNEIPPDFHPLSATNGYVASISTSYAAPNVKITATVQGLDQAYSYILLGSYNAGQLQWQLDPSSTCLSAALCH